VVRLPCKEPWKWPPQWENYLCLKPKTGRACAQLCGFAFLEPRWYRHCIGQQRCNKQLAFSADVCCSWFQQGFESVRSGMGICWFQQCITG
jgi:hypothetical protein